MQLIAAMVGAAAGEAAEDEGPLAGLAPGDLHALMQERTSSHLLEVSTHVLPAASTAPSLPDSNMLPG